MKQYQEAILEQEKMDSKDELKEKLLAAKSHIEHELKRLDKNETNAHLTSVLEKVRTTIDSATRMQDELNRVWKNLEQVHEELAFMKNQI